MKTLHGWLGRVRGGGDAAFALSVLAVVALLVTPLGPRALGALLAVNLAVTATVLVVTLFKAQKQLNADRVKRLSY